MERKSQQQELESAGPTARTDKMQGAISAYAHLTPFILFQILAQGTVLSITPGLALSPSL